MKSRTMKKKAVPRGERLWIGNDPDPRNRKQIVISAQDRARLPPKGAPGTARVTDLLSGRAMTLRWIDCGADCRCALGEV